MRSDSNAMDSGRSINSAVDGGDEQPSIFDLALSTRTTRSGATPHQSMPFPFFDLPQELRDFVYGRLTRSRPMGKTKGRFGGLFNIGTCTSTFPELLLVNKQFTEEYQKEVARHPGSRVAFAQVVCPEQAITIHWHDDFPVEPWLDRIPSSKVFNNVTTLNLRVRIFHGAQMPDIAGHFTFFSIMPSLKTIHLSTERVEDWNQSLIKLKEFEKELLRKDDGSTIDEYTIQRSITWCGVLYSMGVDEVKRAYPELIRPSLSAEDIRDWFTFNPGNQIRYRAKPSTHEHAFMGFDMVLDEDSLWPPPLSFERIEHDLITELRRLQQSRASDGSPSQSWWRELCRSYWSRQARPEI